MLSLCRLTSVKAELDTSAILYGLVDFPYLRLRRRFSGIDFPLSSTLYVRSSPVRPIQIRQISASTQNWKHSEKQRLTDNLEDPILRLASLVLTSDTPDISP
jgi:hypothetical protein